MRILILGATSAIGKCLVRRLVKNAHNLIIAVVRDKSIADFGQFQNLKILQFDMKQYFNICNYYTDAFDWVIPFTWSGLAAKTRTSYDVHKMSYEIMSSFCKMLIDKKIVNGFITPGTQVEYGAYINNGNFMEDAECHPLNAYGAMKFLFFQSINNSSRSKGIKHYHIRFYSVYSEEDKDRKIVNHVAKAVANKHRILLESDCSQSWNLLYVDDAVNAIIQMMNGNIPDGIYNVGHGDSRQLKNYLKTIDTIGSNSNYILFGNENNKNSIMAECRIDKILSTGAWIPTITWEAGANKLLSHYKTWKF